MSKTSRKKTKLSTSSATAKQLSPKRKTSKAQNLTELVLEQLHHFSIDPKSDIGRQLKDLIKHIYNTHNSIHELWPLTLNSLSKLDRKDRISYFNAKRFICFQLAKLLDSLQIPMRKNYQSLIVRQSTHSTKGPYPIFDNITAIFSSTPVITRTSTYLYACTEWIDEAFQGKELLHEIYSRLMNPTSVSLANHIVDVEAGSLAHEYFAWNFNSGMAAIDGILSHLLGYQDIVICSRNIYGGSYQLLHDWFAKKSNLDIGLCWFDGYSVTDFEKTLNSVKKRFKKRLAQKRNIYVYIESPCNPHGYALDVQKISSLSHQQGYTVICDSTVGTPFLQATLRRKKLSERPDFVIHSYTKDLTGTGTTTAGVVIGRNECMFIPKNESVTAISSSGKKKTYHWNETLFWNVYYIKGAFLDADKAFEVLNGMKTLELRMLRKCINTIVLSKALASHPMIKVNCSALEENENYEMAKSQMFLGLPAPLFTIHFEKSAKDKVNIETFKRFFDSLEPMFGLQVSLGQVNTVILCPALTSHSELDSKALVDAGIYSTTIRIAVGDEDPRVLLTHFISTCQQTFDQDITQFSKQFIDFDQIDQLYRETYQKVHQAYIESIPKMSAIMEA